MKKFLLGVTATAAIAAPIALAAPAQADPGSPNCMTLSEWKQIREGMTRTKVSRITGIPGKVTNHSYFSDGEHDISVDYRQCRANGQPAPGSWNTVSIEFANGHYNRNYDWVRGPMQVGYKGYWSSPWW